MSEVVGAPLAVLIPACVLTSPAFLVIVAQTENNLPAK